jgi:type VI secretion system protein ImpE
MDGDARLGPVCETLVNGRYFWLPFSAIAEIHFQAPASVTDLVWRHSLVRLTDGTEQVCQIPRAIPLLMMLQTPSGLGAPQSGYRSTAKARFTKAWGRRPG